LDSLPPSCSSYSSSLSFGLRVFDFVPSVLPFPFPTVLHCLTTDPLSHLQWFFFRFLWPCTNSSSSGNRLWPASSQFSRFSLLLRFCCLSTPAALFFCHSVQGFIGFVVFPVLRLNIFVLLSPVSPLVSFHHEVLIPTRFLGAPALHYIFGNFSPPNSYSDFPGQHVSLTLLICLLSKLH